MNGSLWKLYLKVGTTDFFYHRDSITQCIYFLNSNRKLRLQHHWSFLWNALLGKTTFLSNERFSGSRRFRYNGISRFHCVKSIANGHTIKNPFITTSLIVLLVEILIKIGSLRWNFYIFQAFLLVLQFILYLIRALLSKIPKEKFLKYWNLRINFSKRSGYYMHVTTDLWLNSTDSLF